MDSGVDKDVVEPKKHRNYFKYMVWGISIVVTAATPVGLEYNKYSNKRVFDDGRVNFDTRPTISTVHSGKDDSGKQKIIPVKVVNFGEDEKEYDFLTRLDLNLDLRELYTGQN